MEKNGGTPRINLIKVIALSIVLVVILGYLSVVIFNLIANPTDTFIIENGKLYLEEETDGYILREEVIVQGDNYKNGIVQIKNEGEKVAKDEAIFRYKSNDEEKTLKRIDELNVKIQEALKNVNDILPSDIALLENQIQGIVYSMGTMNKISDVNATKKKINNLILKKAQIVGDYSPAGSYLKELIQERADCENELNSNSEYILAPISGVVSYKIDGYEDFFSSKNIDYINEKLLKSLDTRTGQLIESSNEKAKIVNNYECYIAVVIKSNEAKKAKIGDKVSLEFLNLNAIAASIEKVFDEESGSRVIVFRVNDNVEELLSSRKIGVNIIWWSKSGLKVPNSAIITENDNNYVIRNKAGYKEKILVKVLKQNENYTIIDNYSTAELIELGYSTSDIKKMKKIQLYDELYVK